MENFKIDFGSLKVDQLGFVFKDIEKQAKIMENMLGLPKFIITSPVPHSIQFRGKESMLTSQIAISRIGSTQIELIKWIDGDSSFKEFLDQGKEGLHHVAIYIEDMDKYIEKFKSKGIGILQSGRVLNVRFTFLDSEDKFGFILELLEQISRRKKRK
jgi:methylmalonyl-CoA/ethylmalonyl-CoA epimerase